MKEMEKDKVISKCICKDCPSYVQGADPIGYCHADVGKNSKIEDQNGCICGKCPVQDELNLEWGYYCMKGSAKEQEESGETGSCGTKDNGDEEE